MQIHFTAAPPANVRLTARIVNSGDTLDGLDPALAEAAPVARFKGNAGQIFEGFVTAGGALKRVGLAGAGDKGSDKRRLHLERAGAALTAKYLRSGETEMELDLSHGDLSGEDAEVVDPSHQGFLQINPSTPARSL